MKSIVRKRFFLWLAIFLSGCAVSHRAEIVMPEGISEKITWTSEELAEPIAFRTVKVMKSQSDHLVCLNTAEKPHVHDRHDLSVFVLSGRGRIHLGDRSFEIKPGDIIQIPQGLRHWGENLGKSPTVAYVIFSPPFDGKDQREVT